MTFKRFLCCHVFIWVYVNWVGYLFIYLYMSCTVTQFLYLCARAAKGDERWRDLFPQYERPFFLYSLRVLSVTRVSLLSLFLHIVLFFSLSLLLSLVTRCAKSGVASSTANERDWQMCHPVREQWAELYRLFMTSSHYVTSVAQNQGPGPNRGPQNYLKSDETSFKICYND